MLVARMATEQEQLCAYYSHGMGVSSHWALTLNSWLDPGHCLKIQNVHVVEASLSIVAPKHVQLFADS